MASLVFYMTNSLVSIHQEMSETSPGADATTSPNTGWTVAKTASGNYSPFNSNVEQSAATFHTSPLDPDGSIDTTTGDCLRTTTTYNGSFPAGNWTFNGLVIAVTNGGTQDGNLGIRLFRSANADGSGATEITVARLEGAAVTNLTTTTAQNSSVTFDPGAITVTNEYLFLQLGWEIVGAAGNNNADIIFRIGDNSTRLLSTDFTASGTTYQRSVDGTITPAGALVAKISTALIGSIAPSGALATRLIFTRSVDGTITPAGALTWLPKISLAGSIAPAGGLNAKIFTSLAGVITPVGDLTKKISTSLSGAISPSATLTGRIIFVVAVGGTLPLAGSLNILVRTNLSGSITPIGDLTKKVSTVLSGSITPAGDLTKLIKTTLNGILNLAGDAAGQVVDAVSLFGSVTLTALLKGSAALTALLKGSAALTALLKGSAALDEKDEP